MPKRPPFLPKRAPVGELEIGDYHDRKEDRRLCAFYNGIKEKAESIPYSRVSYELSKKIAEGLTHSTFLPDDRWCGVMSYLGTNDTRVHSKLEYHKNGTDGLPFLRFLQDYFRTSERNNLWTLIWALWIKNCTDVLEDIQTDIAGIVSKHETGERVKETTRCPPTSLDSGFSEPSLSSVESYSGNVAPQSNQVLAMEKYSLTHEMAIYENPSMKDNCLLAPSDTMLMLNREGDKESMKHPVPVHDITIPKDGRYSKPCSIYTDNMPDMSFLMTGDECLKSSKVIRIFVLHTLLERDEVLAEEVKRKLGRVNDIEFETFLLKDASSFFDMDAGEFVMRIIESVDFIVPVLTNAYLEEIQAKGDPDQMQNDRLILRYFHVVSQGRVINKNSLNYLIRPVLCDDVKLGTVRRWNEFRCALQFPKDLSRFAKNLYNTKQLLLERNFCK